MARTDRIEPDAEVVARLGRTALALPETYEEDAWTGIRWRIRAKTFAHVMVAQAGFESSFRDVTGVADPTTILTFRATGDELLALVNIGMPFYKPPWSPTIVGMVIDDDTDWREVADLVTESYLVCAPQKLARLLDEAGGPDLIHRLIHPSTPGPRTGARAISCLVDQGNLVGPSRPPPTDRIRRLKRAWHVGSAPQGVESDLRRSWVE